MGEYNAWALVAIAAIHVIGQWVQTWLRARYHVSEVSAGDHDVEIKSSTRMVDTNELSALKAELQRIQDEQRLLIRPHEWQDKPVEGEHHDRGHGSIEGRPSV